MAENLRKMAKSLRHAFNALPEREGGPPRRPPQGAVVGEFPAPAGAAIEMKTLFRFIRVRESYLHLKVARP